MLGCPLGESVQELLLNRGGILAKFVDSIVVLNRRSSGNEPHVLLPAAQVQLLVRPREGSSSRTDAYIVGARSRVWRKAIHNNYSVLAMRFRPGAARIFVGVPLCDVSNQVLPIQDLWGDDGARMCEQLAGTDDLDAQVRIVENALVTQLARGHGLEDAATQTVRDAARVLDHARQLPTVNALAHQLGIGERRLRRAFNDAAGISPKTYLRILRFRCALQAAQASAAPRWSAVAADAGYYDQAHMIDEFRHLVAATPATLLEEIAHHVTPS
jgi:AraC-like DNA-binding protein